MTHNLPTVGSIRLKNAELRTLKAKCGYAAHKILISNFKVEYSYPISNQLSLKGCDDALFHLALCSFDSFVITTIALCYLLGIRGLEYNSCKALQLFKHSLRISSGRMYSYINQADFSLIYIPFCYENGLGTPKNEQLALEYYQRHPYCGSPVWNVGDNLRSDVLNFVKNQQKSAKINKN